MNGDDEFYVGLNPELLSLFGLEFITNCDGVELYIGLRPELLL